MNAQVLEKIYYLFDPDTFNEMGGEIEAGVITGYGTVNGQLVYIYVQDHSLSHSGFCPLCADKITQIIELACKTGAPIIGLVDSKGAKIDQDLDVLRAYGKAYQAHVKAKGVIPQIIGVLGTAVAADAIIPNLADFVFVLSDSAWHFNLGGAEVRPQATGQADFIFSTEEDCLQGIKNLLSLLPPHCFYSQEINQSQLQVGITGNQEVKLEYLANITSIEDIEIKNILADIFGTNGFLEIKPHYGTSMITGLAKVAGMTVGLIANQSHNAGNAIDALGLKKSMEMIHRCTTFKLPLITFVNNEGFLPDVNQEYMGISTEAAKFITAYASSEIAKITIVMGKAIGSSFNLMGSKAIGADLVYAWPTAQIGLLNPEATNYLLNLQKIKDASNPGLAWQDNLALTKENITSPTAALKAGLIDSLIRPEESYSAIYNSLNLLQGKRVVDRGRFS